MSGVEHRYEVTGHRAIWSGRIFSVVSDDVTMPGGGSATRDYVRHVGAVAVVALDDAGQVVLIRQYRHPVGRHLWELPAGLMDVGGEDLAAAALRELAEVPAEQRHDRHDEEADLQVVRVDLDEAVRMVLAGEITNASCVAGLLAAARARETGFTELRRPEAPLPG